MAKIKIVSAPADYIEKQGKSYPYNFPKTSGSLPDEPIVTTKIKPIPEEDANSEIEKGELVLDSETGTIHKALGNPHSKGGTPVNLKDNSFIFSNFKDLAINKKQKELFEFKLGGNKLKNNTPAKVLEKEIDLEHHNKMVDILQNEKKHDTFATNSAKLMLLKNLEKAGQVAFLQESKKGGNVPDFAKNTAPIYSKDTDEKITQSMQYMKYGGLKKYELGDSVEIYKCPCGEDSMGRCLPCPKDKAIPLFDRATLTNKVPADFQNIYTEPNGRSLFVKSTDTPRNKGKQDPNWANTFKNLSPERQAQIRQMAKQGNSSETYLYTQQSAPVEQPLGPNVPKLQPRTSPNVNLPFGKGNPPASPNGIVDPTTYDTTLTPWQKLNALIPFYRAATVKTQYPLRQHQESVIPQFENQNVQPQLNTINQGYFNTANLTRTLNPNQASSYLQQLYGNRIDSSNQAIGQVQNNNIQIQNRQKEMAANSLNQDSAQNRAFDARFYDQTQTAIKNRDELKQSYEQQGINNLNETMSKKLAFDSWLNSQQQYKGKPTYIDKDGVQHYAGTSLYTPKPNFFGYSVQHNPVGIDFSTYQSTSNKIDSPEELGKAYLEAKKYDDTLKFADFLKFKGLQNYNTSNLQTPSFKKGGKYKPKLRPDKINYYN